MNGLKLRSRRDAFGLPEYVMPGILKILAGVPGLERAYLLVSRATGKFREGSDIDIAVYGRLSPNDLLAFSAAIENLNLIYKVDVVHVTENLDRDLVRHIEVHGIRIYPV